MRGLLKTTIASVEATMNHVDIKPNHAPMNSCSRVWPLERSSTNASRAKDCAWHICLRTHIICLRGLLETIMASLRLSVEATMNHVDIKPNHAPMNSCSCVWALEKSSQKHSGRLHGDVKRTKMSGFFMAIDLPVIAKPHHFDYR